MFNLAWFVPRLGLLQLLCVWVAQCPAAGAALLQVQGAVPFLMAQVGDIFQHFCSFAYPGSGTFLTTRTGIVFHWIRISGPVFSTRVSDPHWFNADPDPAFFLIADPDCGSGFRIRIPDPDQGFDDLKFKKITTEKKIFFFFWIRNYNLHIPRPP